MRFLLDKNVVRRITEFLLKVSTGRKPLDEELKSFLIIEILKFSGNEVYVSKETYNIISRRIKIDQIKNFILLSVKELYPSEYFKRWVRRIRRMTTLTREDAKILAYGTFGTNEKGEFLGIDVVLTLDKKFANEFRKNVVKIEDKLEKMKEDLPEPYNKSKLPIVTEI